MECILSIIKTISAILLGVGLTLTTPLIAEDTADVLLSRAEEAYQKDKLNRAGKLLLRLIRQNPDNKQAFLLMAEVYYAKGEFDKAKKSFEKAAPETIEPRFAFAWGAAFYHAGEWKEAIKGFIRAVEIEGLEDYSHYYLGVSYFQLRNYFRAQQYLSQARSSRLPESLRRNKQQLLLQIRMQKEQDLRSVISGDQTAGGSTSNSKGISRGTPIPTDQNAGVYRFRSPKEAEQQVKENLIQFAYTPGLMLHQASSLYENFSFVRNRVDLTGHRESLAIALTSLVENPDYGQNQTIGLQVFGGNAGYEAKITDERIVRLNETTGGFIQKEVSSINEGHGFFGIEPFFRIPLSPSLTFDAKILHYELLPEYRSKSRWGISQVVAKMHINQGIFTGFGSASFANQFDQIASYEFQDSLFSFGLGVDLQELQIDLSVNYLQTTGSQVIEANPYRYIIADPRMRMPDGYQGFFLIRSHLQLQMPMGNLALNLQRKDRSTFSDQRHSRLYGTDPLELAALSISQVALRYMVPLFTGVSLMAEGFYHLYGDYYFASSIDELSNGQQVLQTGVTQTGYQLGISVTPIDWLRIHANFENHLNQYDQEEGLDQSFKAQNPNFGSTTHFLLEMSKDF
ncbi:MAG: tetratricopeptide repeat protein [Oligoflexus sp.]